MEVQFLCVTYNLDCVFVKRETQIEVFLIRIGPQCGTQVVVISPHYLLHLLTFVHHQKKRRMENMKSGQDDLAGGADLVAFWIKKTWNPPLSPKNFKTGQNNG